MLMKPLTDQMPQHLRLNLDGRLTKSFHEASISETIQEIQLTMEISLKRLQRDKKLITRVAGTVNNVRKHRQMKSLKMIRSAFSSHKLLSSRQKIVKCIFYGCSKS